MAVAPEDKIRAFLALPLAPSFQFEVTPLIEKLKREYPQVRWVRPSLIHLTLQFFGSIGERKVQTLSNCVTPITEKTKPIVIFLEGVGGFPNLNWPRVVWVGVRGEIEALENFQISLEKKLKEAGFDCEKRKFKPHLTLGRLKEGRGFKGIRPLSFGPTPSKKINEIILFQSHLSPEGARYEAVATYPLAAA